MTVHHALLATVESVVPRTPVEEGHVEQTLALSETTDPFSRAAPLHVTGSALIVDTRRRQVLMRWHERQQSWLHVGGHGDPGETEPLTIALREGAEETGLSDLQPLDSGAIPVHLVIVPVPASANEPAHWHVDIRYILTTKLADEAMAEHETAPVRWLSFEDAAALTTEANVRETIRRAEALIDET